MPTISTDLNAAADRAAEALLAARRPDGCWRGRLSDSALSTAVAALALATADAQAHRGRIGRALDWLANHRNADAGWGDTPVSASNVATTALVWSALSAAGQADSHRAAAAQAEAWIARHAGAATPDALADALSRRYGTDKTFSAPILAACALAGRLGAGRDAWRHVPALPFELGAVPRRLLRFAHLGVVSYALPALIAVGQVRHHFRRPRNPLTRAMRAAAAGPTLRLLERIQPESGGFLEAAPLTGFVVLCLAAMGQRDHPVVRRGVAFLTATVRADGSWPIDTDLATWVTTLSVNALDDDALSPEARRAIRDWLLGQQHRVRHPYTAAAPGGWAWTDRPGGVPDADDTAGALLALRRLGPIDAETARAARAGVAWLLGLQNRDGGVPTFCRGWGRLPFDRSSPDLTAHALAAWSAWRTDLPARLARRTGKAMASALGYLARAQRADGAWTALWFGNESARDQANPTYATARVLIALSVLAEHKAVGAPDLAARAAAYLGNAQAADGGWGGEADVEPSIEETALAVDALARWHARRTLADDEVAQAESAIARGMRWLTEHTGGARGFPAAPIGLYFARLWYAEALYPIIFMASALRQARRCRSLCL